MGIKFDQNNSVHRKIAELSKKAHELALKNEPSLSEVEREIDNLVAKIYGLKDDELEKVKASLQLLEGKPNQTPRLNEMTSQTHN